MDFVRVRSFFFFFNDTATTEIYTLSLHDALPISIWQSPGFVLRHGMKMLAHTFRGCTWRTFLRSEEHTSELQSHLNLVCRLLLEKKNKRHKHSQIYTMTGSNTQHYLERAKMTTHV